jgi:hypothetical protein
LLATLPENQPTLFNSFPPAERLNSASRQNFFIDLKAVEAGFQAYDHPHLTAASITLFGAKFAFK